jgi:hypothetical protein
VLADAATAQIGRSRAHFSARRRLRPVHLAAARTEVGPIIVPGVG